MARHTAALPLAALALAAAAPAADAAWPGVNGRISITQRVPAGEVRANRDIFAYTRDSARSRITFSTDNEEQSSWSPDGRWFAFKRRDAVYVAPWDGSVPPRPLTKPSDGLTNNTQPAWSPDGARILFRTNRADPSVNVGDVWIMDVATGEPSAQPLVVRPGDERYPTFSPDGTRLLFRGDDDALPNSDDEEIFVANADGSGITALTDDGQLDSAPAWSPDGTRIAWESRRDGGGDREIFVMDADGTNVGSSRTTPSTTRGRRGRRTGRLIAFTRSATEGDPGDVWVMSADGSDPGPAHRHARDRGVAGLAADPVHRRLGGQRTGSPAATPRWCRAASPRSSPSSRAATWRSTSRRSGGRARLGAPPERARGFDCAYGRHSFDQALVQCDHRGPKKGVAFVYREAI